MHMKIGFLIGMIGNKKIYNNFFQYANRKLQIY